jgi:hypothetical protein
MEIQIIISGPTNNYEFTKSMDVYASDVDTHNYLEINTALVGLTKLYEEAKAALSAIASQRHNERKQKNGGV